MEICKDQREESGEKLRNGPPNAYLDKLEKDGWIQLARGTRQCISRR